MVIVINNTQRNRLYEILEFGAENLKVITVKPNRVQDKKMGELKHSLSGNFDKAYKYSLV